MLDKQTTQRTYMQIKEHAGYFRVPQPGLLTATGDDRVDFIQRQTSNDVTFASSQKVVTTVLTSPTGRILDVFQVYASEDGKALQALTLPGRGAETFNFLKGKIFFMDKVELSDQSGDIAIFDLEGPNAQTLLSELIGQDAPENEELIQVQVDSVPLSLFGQLGLTTPIGYRAMVPNAQADDFERRLAEAGWVELDEATHDILRVEARRAGYAAELTEAYTPLETDMEWATSQNKGCYTGQEVIARQVNYDKVTKHLALITTKELVTVSSKIRADGKNAGVVTSAAVSPELGPICLAILKQPHHEPGSIVSIEDGDQIISGTVTQPK